ncbi:hypothetical protein SteCoe_37408 [Stentor coeruleus]|uniref:Uncharacterized protein n=1 Tax=Stentor coeruleus TaxID=5963 RepID=A0A1R2ANE8_9CILI|nr:hypothetical protein SteCoe_37408 [Stentor coeruleus]
MDNEELETGKNSQLASIKPMLFDVDLEAYSSCKETDSNSGDSTNSKKRLQSVKKNCQIMSKAPNRISISKILRNKNTNKGLRVIPEIHITPKELLQRLKLNEEKRKKKSCACLIF